MAHLNTRAFQLLVAEAKQCANAIPGGGKTQLSLLLKRLEKLRRGSGPSATEAEIRASVTDLFPDFSPQVIHRAARANQPSHFGFLFKLGAIALLGGTSCVWLANLPYPPIRHAVAKTAPMLLFPSFYRMDQNYRGAIAKVEQADQLVNSATSAADIELGAQTVSEAQAHLDQLPVWFLGYEPLGYCHWFGCAWRFTVDEFEIARQRIGRMEAVVFQEQNALTQLQQAEASLQQAQQQHQLATDTTGQQSAIATWQAALDQLVTIPPQTFAGRQTAQQLPAYQRNFIAATGTAAEQQTKNTFIAAAKSYAAQAAQLSQNPPHTVSEWENMAKLWQSAIAQLREVPPENAGYVEAQQLLAQYQTNLGIIQAKQQEEAEAITYLARAEQEIEYLLASASNDPERLNLNQTASSLQAIVNDLDHVKPHTTAYVKAQELRAYANQRLQKLK